MGVNRGSGLHKRSILDKIYQLTGDVVASGLVVVLTGASGVGKGTVRKKLVERAPFYYSISATTRPPRPGERHGVDYWFVSRDEFLTTREQGGFLEWAEYVGSFYGTLAAPVEAAVSAGRNVLLEIEVQGALQVAKRLPEAILVFLIPPSLTELERRLLVRGQDSPEKIQARLARAQEEMAMADSFHYVVVNDVLEQAVNDLWALTQSESLKSGRRAAEVTRALQRDPKAESELALIRAQVRGGENGRSRN